MASSSPSPSPSNSSHCSGAPQQSRPAPSSLTPTSDLNDDIEEYIPTNHEDSDDTVTDDDVDDDELEEFFTGMFY